MEREKLKTLRDALASGDYGYVSGEYGRPSAEGMCYCVHGVAAVLHGGDPRGHTIYGLLSGQEEAELNGAPVPWIDRWFMDAYGTSIDEAVRIRMASDSGRGFGKVVAYIDQLLGEGDDQ